MRIEWPKAGIEEVEFNKQKYPVTAKVLDLCKQRGETLERAKKKAFEDVENVKARFEKFVEDTNNQFENMLKGIEY